MRNFPFGPLCDRSQQSSRGGTLKSPGARVLGRLPRAVWMLAVLGWALASPRGFAGPAFEIWSTDPGDPLTFADDQLVQTPVRWKSSMRPVELVLFRDASGNVILPNSNPNFIDAESVRQALQRAADTWNDASMSQFDFLRAVGYSDYFIGVYQFLPSGPFEVMLDTFNLVTFQDPNLPTLPAGVLAATNIFYFSEDFDFEGPNGLPPGYVLSYATGGVGVITVPGQPSPSLVLPFRKYYAGEIIEADVMMDPGFTDWQLFPEHPDDLPGNQPRQTIRGAVDIQAVFLRELGHVAGLTSTLLQEPVMAATYRSSASGLPLPQQVDPYDARELQLDDKLGIAQAYPSSGYYNAAGIQGEIRDGRAYDTGPETPPYPSIPDTAIFFGRPLILKPGEQPQDVAIDYVPERDTGYVHLLAMTLSGKNMRIPGAITSTDIIGGGASSQFILDPTQWTTFGAVANGNFELHGLPPADDWYVYVDTDNAQFTWTWDFGDRGVFGQIATAPSEFYGGVKDWDQVPQPGDGSAIEDNNPDDLLFANNYLVSTLSTTQQTGFALAQTRPSAGGAFEATISDDESFGEVSSKRSGKEVRFYRNQARPYGSVPVTPEINDLLDQATASARISSLSGDPLLSVETEVELAKFRDDTQPRTFLLTYTVINISNERQEIGFAYVHRAHPGTIASAEDALFAGQTQITKESGYGGEFSTPLPTDIRYLDTVNNPSSEAAFHVLGEGITPPDAVIVGDFLLMQREVLATFVPQGRQLFVAQGAAQPITDIGILYRWNTVTVEPSSTRTYTLAVTFKRSPNSALAKDGPVPTTDPNNRLDDDPLDGDPVVLVAGQTVNNIVIFTNTGTRPVIYSYLDFDGDGVPNGSDNCPWTPNPGQESDANSLPRGTACLTDFDNDGVNDTVDNCPEFPNPDQMDLNQNGVGDGCDTDIDGDGVPNVTGQVPFDNCPYTYNPDQRDNNGNGIGDACEGDMDGDGIEDETDNCPTVFNPDQADFDQDGIGDACDDDLDGDGVLNASDNCPRTFNPPPQAGQAQADADGDGIGDACDQPQGITLTFDNTPDKDGLPPFPKKAFFIKGAAFGDLNGDGHLDIVIATAGGTKDNSALANRILMNQGYRGKPGVFVDETFGINGVPDSVPVGQPGGGDDRLYPYPDNSWDVKLADVDLDGDLDIFFSNFNPYNAPGDQTYGDECRLLINIDVDAPTINPNVDNDDIGDGFFVDATDDFLPGVLNTKGMVGPNPIAYQLFGDPYIPVYTPATRSEWQDIDGDGDPDLIISCYNPIWGQHAVTQGGLPDLAGTFLYIPSTLDIAAAGTAANLVGRTGGPQASQVGEVAAVATGAFIDQFNFSEMIWINRRDELLMLDPNDLDSQGQPRVKTIPRGTPDAFLVFKDQDETFKRRAGFSPDPDPTDFWRPDIIVNIDNGPLYAPQMEGGFANPLYRRFGGDTPGQSVYLGRRLDKYFFRDDTLGRDGVFGGTQKFIEIAEAPTGSPYYPLPLTVEVNPANLDRLPPCFPDLTSTVPSNNESNEGDPSFTYEVVAADLIGDSGPEIVVANALPPLIQHVRTVRMAGYDPLFYNQDITDETGAPGSDGVADGYYYLWNFGSDDLVDGFTLGQQNAALNNTVTYTILTIPDGFTNDAVAPEQNYVTWAPAEFPTDYSMGMLIGDFDYSGTNEFLSYTDAGTEPFFYDTVAETSWGGNFFRGQFGFVFGTSRELYSDLLGLGAGFSSKAFLPARTGRTLHACISDLNNDGALEILMAQDAPPGVNLQQVTSVGGIQAVYASDSYNNSATSWVNVAETTLKPINDPVAATYVMVGDVDNDGDQDVFLGVYNAQSRMYVNNLYSKNPRGDQAAESPGSHVLPSNYINSVDMSAGWDGPLFYDQTALSLPPYANGSAGQIPAPSAQGSVTIGVQTGDIDRNGLPDLLFVGGGEFSENGERSLLLVNHGLGSRPYAMRTFEPTNRAWPAPRMVSSGWPNQFLDNSSRPGYDGAIFDYDQDGDLDIFIDYYQDRCRLFENRNSGDPRLFDNFPAIKNEAAVPKQYFNTFGRYDTDPRDPVSFDLYSNFSSLTIRQVELGNGCLEDVTDDVDMPSGGKLPQRPVSDPLYLSRRPGLGDLNGDTFIDILVANGLDGVGIPNVLLQNVRLDEGDVRTVRYADRSDLLPEARVVDRLGNPTPVVEGLHDNTTQAIASDFDGDGDIDLFFVNRAASDSSVEIPGNPNYQPNFVWRSRLLVNQGNNQGGQMGLFVDASDFVGNRDPSSRTDLFYHRLFTSAKACDINQDGDFCEDADGNGVVTDEEILAFENLIGSLNQTLYKDNPIVDSFQDSRIQYQTGTTAYGSGLVQGPERPPVDQLIPNDRLSNITRPEVPHGDVSSGRDLTTLWRRKPRWIDHDGNTLCNPSYDLVLTVEDGGNPVVLLNNNDGTFTDVSGTALPQVAGPTYFVDIADLDLDGKPDVVMGRRVPTVDRKSVIVLHNRTADSTHPVFADVTQNEFPDIVVTRYAATQSDPSGFTHALKLTDIDGDGDFDLVVGNAGDLMGAQWYGAPNQMLFNRIRGASWNARNGLFRSRATGSSGPIIDKSLQVLSVFPQFVSRGTSAVMVSIYGTNFKSGAKVYFGEGVTVLAPPVVRSDQILEVSVRVEKDAQPGPRPVTVKNLDGEAATNPKAALIVTAADVVQQLPGQSASDSHWSLYQ